MNLSLKDEEMAEALQFLAVVRWPSLDEAIDRYLNDRERIGNEVAKNIAWLYRHLEDPSLQSLRTIGETLLSQHHLKQSITALPTHTSPK